jgi:cyclophilin family peptidyl-prolyl cis-trans isomerase
MRSVMQHVVFGSVVEGMDVVKKVEGYGSGSGGWGGAGRAPWGQARRCRSAVARVVPRPPATCVCVDGRHCSSYPQPWLR